MRREHGQFSGHRVPDGSRAFADISAEVEFPPMLPGFRFLFAAIMLSISIMVFGLGAAALLRAAHEEFASNPSWRAAPGATFAQPAEAPRPVLAMLRFDPPPAEQKASDNVPAASLPAVAPADPAEQAKEQAQGVAPAESVPSVPVPAEQAATAPPPPERVAALRPEEPAPSVTANPDQQASENAAKSEAAPAQSEAAPAQIDAPAAEAAKAATPDADAGDTKVASTEQASPPALVLPPASEAAPVASEPSSAPASPDSNAVSTKIATLGGPTVAIETRPPAKAIVHAKPEHPSIKKRQHARRAVHRRRLAARARKPRVVVQQPANPFAQSFAQPPTAARNY
jgi:hypothetical protein